jgi:hypothetical protein
LIPSSANFGIVAHEERLHRALLWAEKLESPASPAPTDAQLPPISDTTITQPTATVPSPPISPIIQPTVQVPTVQSPSPPISPIIQPPAQVPTVPSPSPPISPIIQPTAQVSTVPSPPLSPIIQPPAQVPTVPSLNITNPQTYSLSFAPNPNRASFPDFVPNFNQTFSPALNLDFNANPQSYPQQSLMDLMSESFYNWPNQAQQGIGDQDLFNFSGLQDFSGMNNYVSDRSFHLPNINVRLVLQASGSTDFYSYS